MRQCFLAIATAFFLPCGFAVTADRGTPKEWILDLKEKSFSEAISFILDEQGLWPVLHSRAWTERQSKEVQVKNLDDAELAFRVLDHLQSEVEARFISEADAVKQVTQMIRVADVFKTKGGHINEVLSLAFEKAAIHRALVDLAASPNEAKKYSLLFTTAPGNHIQTKAWLRMRASEDAWLHDKPERIEILTDEDQQSAMTVLFRLAQGVEVPKYTDDRPRGLIRDSNAVGLWLQAIVIEFQRTVSLPLMIDYLSSGGTLSPRPADPARAVREKIGVDMSKYEHSLPLANVTAHEIWRLWNSIADEHTAQKSLSRWLK